MPRACRKWLLPATSPALTGALCVGLVILPDVVTLMMPTALGVVVISDLIDADDPEDCDSPASFRSWMFARVPPLLKPVSRVSITSLSDPICPRFFAAAVPHTRGPPCIL